MEAFPDNRVVLTTTVGSSPVAVEEGRLEGTQLDFLAQLGALTAPA